MRKILVLGGTGHTGRHVVKRLEKEGYGVRVLTRNKVAAERLLGRRPEIFEGNLASDMKFATLVSEIDAVIATQGADDYPGANGGELIDYRGIQKVIGAIQPRSAVQFILMSAIYASRKSHPMNQPGEPIYWKAKGEEALQRSGLPYTIVRASWLTNDNDDQAAVRLEQGDTGEGKVSRIAVAEVLVQALVHKATGKVMEVYRSDTKIMDWKKAFDELATTKHTEINRTA